MSDCKRSRQKERGQKAIDMRMQGQLSLRRLIDILKIKYLLFGSDILLRCYVLLSSNTLDCPHLCSRSLFKYLDKLFVLLKFISASIYNHRVPIQPV